MATTWYILLGFMLIVYVVLDGFDLGVGILHLWVARTDHERRTALAAIGPVWDGNEVWLIVAGAGTFAAFPGWYATMFSGLYLAMVLLLVALILRGLSFEFAGRRDGRRWRRAWSAATTYGSLLVPLLIGVALGNLLHGVPIGADQEYAGNLVDLLNPYSLFCGLTLVLLCLLHGASFLALRTSGEVRGRALGVGRRIALPAAAAVVGFVIWTQALAGDESPLSLLPGGVAVLAALAAAWQVGRGRDGLAFAATAVTMAATVVTLFVALYPRVMVSTLGAANDLTVTNTASSPYTLRVMTVVAAVLFPVVLAYQGWTYYVFRRRVGGTDTTVADSTAGPAPGAW
ncbi:MAG: cytochrome d ubiquinol oxidase subunit II [Actinomycetes bacterium]